MNWNTVNSAIASAGALVGDENFPWVLAASVFCVMIFLWLFLWLFPIRLWVWALTTKTPVGMLDMIFMRFRRVPPAVIVEEMINATQAGIPITRRQIESHYLAGGNVHRVVRAMISSHRAGIELTLDEACAIDLAGRDVFEAVNMSVKPWVIDCPNPASGKTTIDGVAKNGIQLRAKARVTVRANISRLIGGATEETVIARVGEGIVSAIGSAESHKEVLEHPDMISKAVLAKGLDSGTAFSILSIDIADVDVGINIGAKLQIDQAEADKEIAQALAEKRRAMAVAAEQEMRAREQEMRSRVVEAEAEVPKAIAEAFRSGQLGVMDYYNMKNVMSDTDMRQSISRGYTAKPAQPDKPEKPTK
ncbi:MAG TPA: flotillin-like protein FloA [Candidatus Sumerlaeota bacterium]|nr:flotillin-like protein FloA [Candidatus Sumerlaeota bacterium]HPS02228.1 flotillin-like protein FloA [Candidatus Sumerlaeota bacterium]